jgi:hypothetical protein
VKKLTLKDLNEINNKYADIPNVRNNFVYDEETKSWKFTGYSCCKCQRVFKAHGFLKNHKDKCPGPKDKNDIEGKIMTVDRKIWQPLDINQNLPNT